MTTTINNDKINAECHRCCGQGRIDAFSGIANGVCFACKGTKVIAYDRKHFASRAKALNATDKKKADWILSASKESFAKLTWEQLQESRRFVLSETMAGHPEVYAAWSDKAWERFDELQQAENEKFMQRMAW